MVLKGQFLERPTLIPLANGLVLEGVSHRGVERPGLLVLPPPHLEGGGMDHVVGAELAFAVSRSGHPTLRFNYRGVGGSQGSPSRTPSDWLDDAQAALQLALDNTEGAPVVVASIGASDAVALELAKAATVSGVALINPSIARPSDLGHLVGKLVGVVIAEMDEAQDRGGWSAALESIEGTFTLIPGASRTYQRNLPLVGQAVASLIGQARTTGARRPHLT